MCNDFYKAFVRYIATCVRIKQWLYILHKCIAAYYNTHACSHVYNKNNFKNYEFKKGVGIDHHNKK